MSWLQDAATVWSGCAKAVSWLRSKPRIAGPSIGIHESVQCPQPHVAVTIENAGRGPLDIEEVRFSYQGRDSARCRVALTPEADGPIPAKRGIDKDAIAPQWRRSYLLLGHEPAKYYPRILGEVFEADPATYRLEVWVQTRDKPLWVGSTGNMAEFRRMIAHAYSMNQARL